MIPPREGDQLQRVNDTARDEAPAALETAASQKATPARARPTDQRFTLGPASVNKPSDAAVELASFGVSILRKTSTPFVTNRPAMKSAEVADEAPALLESTRRAL